MCSCIWRFRATNNRTSRCGFIRITTEFMTATGYPSSPWRYWPMRAETGGPYSTNRKYGARPSRPSTSRRSSCSTGRGEKWNCWKRPIRVARFDYKVALTRKLYEQGLSRDDIITLYKFLDWVMTLPEDLKIQYNQSIDEIEKERNVQILTSIEERGWKKGIQQGMQASQAEVWRKAKLEDAREMRAAQLDLDLIKRITKLTDEDLAELE